MSSDQSEPEIPDSLERQECKDEINRVVNEYLSYCEEQGYSYAAIFQDTVTLMLSRVAGFITYWCEGEQENYTRIFDQLQMAMQEIIERENRLELEKN